MYADRLSEFASGVRVSLVTLCLPEIGTLGKFPRELSMQEDLRALNLHSFNE